MRENEGEGKKRREKEEKERKREKKKESFNGKGLMLLGKIGMCPTPATNRCYSTDYTIKL